MRRCCRGQDSGWRAKFRGCGYRFTLPRQLILDVLEGSKDHLSAEDIYNEVSRKDSGAGVATVYRTLELLSDMGIIDKIDFGDGCARYELSSEYGGDKHHHHLVCQSCGRIVEYSDFVANEKDTLCSVQDKLEKKFDFDIERHSVIFYGICGKCSGGRGG